MLTRRALLGMMLAATTPRLASASVDTVWLQTQLAQAAPGAVIQLQARQYVIDQRIDWPVGKPVTLRGVQGKTVLLGSVANPMFMLPGPGPAAGVRCQGAKFENLIFDGQRRSWYGIWAVHSHGFSISDCVFRNMLYDGFTISGGQEAVTGISIQRISVSGSGRHGFHLGYASGVAASDIYIRDPASMGIDLEPEGVGAHVANVAISRLVVDRGTYPMISGGVSAGPANVRDAQLSNVTIRNGAYYWLGAERITTEALWTAFTDPAAVSNFGVSFSGTSSMTARNLVHHSASGSSMCGVVGLLRSTGVTISGVTSSSCPHVGGDGSPGIVSITAQPVPATPPRFALWSGGFIARGTGPFRMVELNAGRVVRICDVTSGQRLTVPVGNTVRLYNQAGVVVERTR